MNCRDFELIALLLARGDEFADRAEGLAHAATCAVCARRLAEAQALWLGVRAIQAELAAAAAPARVETVLLAAFRAQTERKDARANRLFSWRVFGWRVDWRWGAAWATAALLLALLVAGVAWLKPKPDAPQEAVLPTPSNSRPSAVAEQRAATASPQRLARTVKPRRNVHKQTFTTATPPPFYPLVEAGEMVTLESGRIVRIEVPAATLVTLGVPLTDATLKQPVQADLLLGQDGLARAIRFLPAEQFTKSP